MGRWSSAYFDREYNAWTVARHDTSRAGRAESYTTYPDRKTAERVAREENAEEERAAEARRTITHNEATQAVNDVAEYRRRFPGQPFHETWFIVQFNAASERAKLRWKWEVYRAAVQAAWDAATKPKRARRSRKT